MISTKRPPFESFAIIHAEHDSQSQQIEPKVRTRKQQQKKSEF